VARVPIVALTANGTAADRERCLATGMDDHLPKPLQLEALSGVVRRFLDPRLEPAPSGSSAGGEGAEIDGETIESLRALAEGDAAFLRELLDQFRADAGDQLASLERAIERRDRATVHSIAHALRGSSANLGAVEVVRACRTIEAAEEHGYAAAIDDLRRACDRALPKLTQALG
jgi:two-component system sensor histidine kinase/response regulator